MSNYSLSDLNTELNIHLSHFSIKQWKTRVALWGTSPYAEKIQEFVTFCVPERIKG